MESVSASQTGSLEKVAVALIVAGGVGFFGGLLAVQPLIMLAAIIAFIVGLVLRGVGTRRAIKSLPVAQATEARRQVDSRVQWMYVAVLVGFVSFMIRFLSQSQ